MADIPTFVTSGDYRTGPTGPVANPADFGAQEAEAAQGLGQSMERGARMGARAINRVYADKRVRDAYNDARWSSEAYEQEKRVASEFMANPENHSKESFATDLDAFIGHRMEQYTGDTAPSAKALDILKQNMGSFRTTMYDRALGISAQNAVTNGVNSIDGQITDAMATYRNSRALGDQYASKDIVDSTAHIANAIDAQFGKLAPKIASQLHENLITSSVLASMVHDPETAKSILDWSKVGEQTRYSLSRSIEQAGKSRDAVELEAFDNQRQNTLVASENGLNRDKIDISLYRQYYPDDKAVILKSKDDAYIDSMNKSNDFVKMTAPWEGSYQLKALDDFRSKIQTEDDKVAYQHMHRQVMDNVKMQGENPVGWLQKNNPTVANLLQRAADAPKDQQAGAITSLNDAVLKYQGSPPPGATEEERRQYLNRPVNDRHLLGTNEATQTASDLNVATPKEFLKKMGEMLGRYPDNDHQMHAFNDLVTMPSKGNALKQDYQLAWQNKDAWWIDNYLGALSAGKDIKISEDDQRAIEKSIDNNKTWLQFKSAMIGDNFQRASEINGFHSGIIQYARALSTQGSLSQAADKSVNMLLNETLGITKINGRPMVVDRDQGAGKPKMSDGDVSNLGRRLGLALQFVDPRQVDQSSFLSLQMFGKDENKIDRLQALRDSVTARGFFQTNQDGKSASLYYTDENGSMFQIRDRQNHPFNVHFSDLPMFETKGIGGLGALGVAGAQSDFAGRPMKHYPIITKPDPIFSSETRTNWPASADWLKH